MNDLMVMWFSDADVSMISKVTEINSLKPYMAHKEYIFCVGRNFVWTLCSKATSTHFVQVSELFEALLELPTTSETLNPTLH